jgi:hypothetical protein
MQSPLPPYAIPSMVLGSLIGIIIVYIIYYFIGWI